ncbi:probable insulin-like peptide 7 [Anopheles ziemanni]|uniref:probable insulin-like peptide 7 n=1 Tax=Anopheles coustani TaxID=139045 RepID=UPI00265AF7B6|nr:probable insulin-like peptide 7 [Anopheles coustani]XP_058173214.1 probable insulin-like peptide 7 [Anopheles ziemanni]
MWLPLALCILLEFAELVSGSSVSGGGGGGGGGGVGLDDGQLEVTFSERTRADWEKVWHQESHSRCREKLIRHLYWACEKDIYRISRRSGSRTDGMLEKRAREDGDEANALEVVPASQKTVSFPWAIDREVAYSFLRTRRTGKRRSGGSITAECCTRIGCTWEEYAEYCPSNKRLNHYRRRK